MTSKFSARRLPSRLRVYRDLCDLSPLHYFRVARLIAALAVADRVKEANRAIRRAQRRQAGNIGKPVIHIHADDDRPGA